jgi:hypothetical protein
LLLIAYLTNNTTSKDVNFCSRFLITLWRCLRSRRAERRAVRALAAVEADLGEGGMVVAEEGVHGVGAAQADDDLSID